MLQVKGQGRFLVVKNFDCSQRCKYTAGLQDFSDLKILFWALQHTSSRAAYGCFILLIRLAIFPSMEVINNKYAVLWQHGNYLELGTFCFKML